MKIGFLCRYPWSLQYGGAEIQAINYIKELNNLGVNCDFIDVYSRKNDYDIIHCMGLNLETETIVNAAKRDNQKVVISPIFYLNKSKEYQLKILGTLSRFRFNAMYKIKLALENCDVILPNSNEEARQLSSLFCISKRKFEVVFNGVNENFFFKKGSISDAKDKFILCAAMIDERKNTLRLIQGFLRAKLPHKLVLLGDFRSSSEAYINEIKNLIKENGNIEHINFVESSDALRELYSRADIHALPSALETPGLSTIEALATGTPCVVGDCKPVREYFENNVVYVNYRSEVSIAEGLKTAAMRTWNEDDLRGQVLKYSWPEIAKQLISTYNSILNK